MVCISFPFYLIILSIQYDKIMFYNGYQIKEVAEGNVAEIKK